MTKKIYSFIVILYTIFTICIFKFYATDRQSEEVLINIFDRDNLVIDKDKIFNVYEENKMHGEEFLNKDIEIEEEIKRDSSKNNFNEMKLYRDMYLYEFDEKEDFIVEGEFDSYNIEQKKKNSVIKIPPEEIETALSLNDKVKLFTISDKIPKEEQNKISDYLQYKNQKIGVRKSLDILKNYLSEKELYEVKKIARKFIDMDTVENDN